MVQPGFLQSGQSKVGLVLHILPSGFGGEGKGTLWPAEGVGGGLYQFRPAAPPRSFGSGSLRIQMPSLRGNVLGRT